MYKYFLGAFGNRSYIIPQFEILDDGSLRGIENRWEEFPNGGTVSVSYNSDSEIESIKNRLLKFRIDFNKNLHPNYVAYGENSNKYQISLNSALDAFDENEIIEIIDIDFPIDDFLNDKSKRLIIIKHKPNKMILLRYGQDCYGPFEFMISDIEESYGDESYYTLKVFVNSGEINHYRSMDIERIVRDGRFSIKRNDRLQFIYALKNLQKIEPFDKLVYYDNEEIADFFKKLMEESDGIENLANIREQFLQIADTFSEEDQLSDDVRIKRICELLQTSVDLSDYKLRLIEEYFKLSPNAQMEKEDYLHSHEELLDNLVRQDVHYDERKNKIMKEIEYLMAEKEELSLEIEKSNQKLNDKQAELERLHSIFDCQNVKDKKMNQITKTRLDRIIEKMKEGKHTISARSLRAIGNYYLVAEKYMSSKETALDFAISQKILPCINGNGKKYGEFLNGLMTICKENQLNRSASIIAKIIEKSVHDFYSFFSV